MKKSKIFAFTLAEVLITLGIIGVVAALTIPTLISNYQIRSWNTAASNFEARFGEALKVMNTQQTLAHLGTTEKFVQELQKHMKIAKVCDNNELFQCFPKEIYAATSVIDVSDPTTYENTSSTPVKTSTIMTAKELGQKDWNTKAMGLQFANGVSAILAYNPKCNANPFDSNAITISGGQDSISFGTDCVAMVYDVSANANPNEKGKDIRTSSMATVGDAGCAFKIGGTCVTKLVTAVSPVTKSECENMMSTHGITMCGPDTDYWAGAVKVCGHKDKILSLADYEEIAKYIYINRAINVERVNKLGFQLLYPTISEKGTGVWWVNTEATTCRTSNGVGNCTTEGPYAHGLNMYGDTLRNKWGYDRTSNLKVVCKE